ncbi:MAG: isopentenyl-diphosphate Delta-isomerase [Acidimicrobiales bacterium]
MSVREISQATEHVVLLDRRGRPVATEPKAVAHHDATALHLAFSCHLVRADGAVLLTRRALSKRTWPGTWTNGCCGHPQTGETMRQAITRRVGEELGLAVGRVGLALPDFAYRAQMADGTVEHELCPVAVAEVTGPVAADPDEVDDLVWLGWDDLVARATHEPATLSPWSVEQIRQLHDLAPSPAEWLDGPAAARSQTLLDQPIALAGAPAPVAPAGDPLAVVRGPLRELLGTFLDAKAAETVAVDPALAEVTDEIRALVDAGGKRLRPAFVYWGHRAAGADHDEAVLRPAAAVELLHTFALLHDDVMDRSATRRGRPSAYAGFAQRHLAGDRLGDSDWFGCSAAILAGDLTYVWADELFDATDLPADAVARARAVFTTLRREVIAGQHLDLVLAADPAAHEDGARHVALLKSARYTVTRPLELGAALAPEGHLVSPLLAAYGDAVGIAFQMRDDILGLFGDPAVTGKSALDDLREGKRTVLVLRALRLADDGQRRVLEACLGDPDLDEERAAEARAAVADSGALASVEALLAAQHALALEALVGLPEPAASALRELAGLAIERRW